MDEDDTDDDHDEFRRNFTSTCEKRSIFFDKLDILTNSFDKYLNQSEINTLRKTNNVMKILSDYACSDDGTRILKLRSSEATRCIRQTDSEVTDCIRPFTTEFSSYGSLPQFLMAIEESQCDLKVKDNMKGIENCIVTILSTCSDILGPVFEKILNVMFHEFSCN